MLTKRILFLCMLFAVGKGTLSAQHAETLHIDFLKRLAAGIEAGELEGKSVKQFMFEEKIALLKGDISMLNYLLNDSTALTEIVIAEGKRCAANFYKDSLRVLTITYPADYQLILGVTLMDAEDNLLGNVLDTPMPSIKNSPVSQNLLTQRGNSIIYVKTGNSYIIPGLNSNQYYVATVKKDVNETDTLSLFLSENMKSDSASVNELGDSVEEKVHISKGENWFRAFIKRIFSRRSSNYQDTLPNCETVGIDEHKDRDSIVSTKARRLSDSLEKTQDSLVFELLCSEDMPAESMANLVTSNEIDDSISIDILLVKYGYRTERFTVPLRQWIAFCHMEGCKPYFGVISQDSSKVVCELIMLNELLGYVHVMKLSFDPNIIAKRKGTAKARLNSYVPINNLQSLFGEDE